MQKLLYRFKSDESLMLDYQRGEARAFEVLYGRHKDSLVAFLFRQCGQAGLVEDLAQETWMAIIRGADRYQVRAKFKTFLYQIAHNKMVDHWRRESIRPRLNSGADTDVEALPSDLADNPHSVPIEPELAALHDQRNRHIQGEVSRALLALAPEQRDAFLLREAGFSQLEIATITNTGAETVKSRLRYAGKHLKARLQASLVLKEGNQEGGNDQPNNMTEAQ